MLDRSTIGVSNINEVNLDQPTMPTSFAPNTTSSILSYNQSVLQSYLPMPRTPVMEQSLMPDMTPAGLNPLPPRPVNVNVAPIYDDDDVGEAPPNNDLQKEPPLMDTRLGSILSVNNNPNMYLNRQLLASRRYYRSYIPNAGYGLGAGTLGPGMAPLNVNNDITPVGPNIIDAFR